MHNVQYDTRSESKIQIANILFVLHDSNLNYFFFVLNEIKLLLDSGYTKNVFLQLNGIIFKCGYMMCMDIRRIAYVIKT